MSGAWLNCVIFSLRVSFKRYSQQNVLLTHPNKFPFSKANGVISTARVGCFSRALTCFAGSNTAYKKLQCDCQEKKYTFLSSQNRHKFSYFQLARRSFRFPSQLISQCLFFPASSNSAWRAGILSSGSVGYSCPVCIRRQKVEWIRQNNNTPQ